jgi:hypothetical protein
MVLAGVLTLGMVLPRFIIGDGVDQYEGNEKNVAQEMLLYTGVFFAGEPYSQLAITARRVSRVRMCPRPGEVRIYTIFGIPYGELRFQCTGSDIIRCPAAGAECKQGDGARSNMPKDGRVGRLAESVGRAS